MAPRREKAKNPKARRELAARLFVICAFVVCAVIMLAQAAEYVLSFRRKSMVFMASAVRAVSLATEEPGGRININIATEKDLRAVPGLGPELARRILALREERNGFHVLEELKDVNGIGDKRFHALKEYFCCPLPDIQPRGTSSPASF